MLGAQSRSCCIKGHSAPPPLHHSSSCSILHSTHHQQRSSRACPPVASTRFGRRSLPNHSATGKNQEVIQGYTPANYISYSDQKEHACRHLIGVSVRAPASTCFDLWNDWARLVDFLDLISQIGLDPEEPNMGLFQCFYRWGRMPVMEIVFLAHKKHVEQDRLIQFETVWGLPAKGEVEFIADGPNTTVLFRFEHQMPVLLVELKVSVLTVETHLKSIFAENMEDFKQLAEMLAQEPGNAPPRREAEHIKAVGGSGAPPATRPQDSKPWEHQQQQQEAQQEAQQQASSSGRGSRSGGDQESGVSASGGRSSGRGRSKSRASPTPVQQTQQQEGEGGEELQVRRRGRPKSRMPSSSATPSPPSTSSNTSSQDLQQQGGGVGSPPSSSSAATDRTSDSRNGVGVGPAGRRSARSSSPAVLMGQPRDGSEEAQSANTLPVSPKGRRSKSTTSQQQQ